MSHYIRCPSCDEDGLDVDTLHCDCGFRPNIGAAEVAALQRSVRELTEAVRVLAKAVIVLSDEAARTWDYDGEQMTVQGVIIPGREEIERLSLTVAGSRE